MFQGTHTQNEVYSRWSARRGPGHSESSLAAGALGRHCSSCSEASQETLSSLASHHSQIFTKDPHVPGTELGTQDTKMNQPHGAKTSEWAGLLPMYLLRSLEIARPCSEGSRHSLGQAPLAVDLSTQGTLHRHLTLSQAAPSMLGDQRHLSPVLPGPPLAALLQPSPLEIY